MSYKFHPAGDVTRVSVMPRKVTVKIGDAKIKINEKGQNSCSFSSISCTLYVWSLKLRL